MAIYIDDDTQLVVQGASGRVGRELVSQTKQLGTDVVAGIAPGHGKEEIDEVPVLERVSEAVERGADTSLIVVPSPYVTDACFEAIDAGIETIVVITEDVPVQDVLRIREYAARWGTTVVGPNTLGVISPEQASAMLLYECNDHWFQQGNVGLVARSGSLSVELAHEFTKADLGQSTVLSVGGDPYVGTPPVDVLREFDDDPETEEIVYVGEIGSNYEAKIAEALPELETPVYASIVGRNAPPGKRMGHAGAIAEDNTDKLAMLEDAGATVSARPHELVEKVRETR